MCDNACSYEFSGDGTTTRCGSLTGGDPSQLYCVFTYTGTGSACIASDEPSNSNAPPNPDPPKDPNDPTDPRNNCGPDHAWSGTTCVPYLDPDDDTPPTDPSPGDGGSDPGTGGGGGGGNGGGGNGGGSGSDPGTGGGGGGGGGGSGDGDGKDEGGPAGKLEQGKQGDFSEGIAEWDEKIAEVRADLDQKIGQYSGLFKGVFDLNLGSPGGSLPCYNVPLNIGSASSSGSLCLSDYENQLVFLRYILLLVAAVFAAFIVLRD
ncbi:hypothetical protein [Pseudomonas sp. sia0905]|uniref:hypothetical protein n=1 Tax=Pseudomonas sp. sia0905 TaxID=2854783 RepID=UPI001C4902DC|nr:hypothetical protein [Pseudomonas sp. sia0905]MBV7564161.1 hypothetical protein [Pseudomonas sp. sia0905]